MNSVAGLAFFEAVTGKIGVVGLVEQSMRGFVKWLSCLGLLLGGYVVGSLQLGRPSVLRAEQQAEPLPNAVRDRLREADRSLSETMQVLQDEKRYVPAIQGLNSLATSAGGVDAIADLESGQGVDPETFAGLYAGQAVAEVAEHLGRDPEGRVTYKNRVVRIYSAMRLRQLFAARAEFLPAGAVTSTKRSTAPAKKEAEEGAEKSKDDAPEKGKSE